MGNTCSCCSYAISLPQVEVVSHLDDVISFIEMPLEAIFIDKPKESTSGAEITVAPSIEYGSYFLESVARLVNRHTCKIVKVNRDIQKVVTDILKGGQKDHCVGAALGVVAYVLDQMDKTSTCSSECVEVLRFMCRLAKHIKRRSDHLPQEKLDDVVVFIVKGSIFCMSRIQSTNHSRSFSALVDEEEIKSLQSQLTVKYPELGQYPDEDDKQKGFDLTEEDILSSLDELMSYIQKYLARPPATDGAEEITSGTDGNGSSRVASTIEYGRHLLQRVWRRCQRHNFKSGETIKVVIDVLKETSQIPWVGAGLSVVAYVLQKVDNASTNKEECVEFLRHMCHLATHIRRLNGQIYQKKLHDVAEFIFEGSFFCLSRIQSTNLSRIFSAVVDGEQIKTLQSKLVQSHQDLTLEALIEALRRLPIVLPPSQGQKNPDAVGIDESVLEVTKLLGMENEEDVSTRAVVVYGVGGMGKTTLANAVFSSLNLNTYKYCHLIIKQDCSETDLRGLQQQILNDLFDKKLQLRNFEEGREEISKVFREAARQPLFLFIDNALKGNDLAKVLPEDLSCMPKRSRMLVTTRKLDETDMLDQKSLTRLPYAMNYLPHAEAKKLLSKKALDSSVGTFDASSDIDGLLGVCGGIPLVLNLVGSRLRKQRNDLSALNRTIEDFKDSLGRGESEVTQKVVDVVYESLQEDRYKDTFLEIAAFFSSWKQHIVSYIVGHDELAALVDAALVKISSGKVELHDVVLARGRKLSESDRVTDPQSLADIIEDTERLEKLKGIHLPFKYSFNEPEFQLQAKHLDKMHKCLRVLILGTGRKVGGECIKKFENLRYLEFDNGDCSPIELKQAITPRLAIFKGHRTSDVRFSDLPCSLRRLKVDALESVELDESFGKLSRLEELELRQDKQYMMRLPQSFGQLKSLRSLKLYRFRELTSLPDDFGQMKSLINLKIKDCESLEKLSYNFGQLSNLKELSICECPSLLSLSDDFVHLKSLDNLKIWDCQSLGRLSDNFGQLSNLKELTIGCCRKLSNLSDDFGQMKSLLNLNIDHCQSLERLSDTFGRLSNLKELDIIACSSLFSLSDDFGHLKSLIKLNIDGCGSLERLSDTFGELSNLKKLTIRACPQLSNLSGDFGQMKSLEYLNLEGCRSLERLSDTFPQLRNLKELDLSGCTNLSSLCDGFGQLKSLEYLNFWNCRSLQRLSDDFGSLTCVAAIDASMCPVLEGKAVDQMIELKSLMELNICESQLLIKRWEKIKDGHPQLVLTREERDTTFKFPAGIGEAQDEVIKLLELEDESTTRAVVLHGVGGIGKTTLATAVFNSLRSACVENLWVEIKQDCKEHDLKELQERVSYQLRELRESWSPVFLFIDNALRGSDLAEILPKDLSLFSIGGRMVITTRKLDETQVIEERGVKRYPYSVKGLSEEESKKILCLNALGSADNVFDKSLDIDGLLKICGGIPGVLEMSGSMLRELGNDVGACENIIEYLKGEGDLSEKLVDTLEKGEGDLSEKLVDVVYNSLQENLYKDAFLDIAAFFNNWDERSLGYIVGEAALKAIKEAALVKISEQGRVIVKNSIFLARGIKLSEKYRITDSQSLQSSLQDTQRLEKMKGIRLLWDPLNRFGDQEFHLQAEHLDKMHNCLRVLTLSKGTKVTGACTRKFENLRYLKVNNGDCSPMELNKLPSLAIFEGRIRSDDRFCDLPDSLRRLKVDALESPGLDEHFGKLSLLEDLDISQNETYMRRLPESFGQLKSLRCLKLSSFRELTSLPDTFCQLSNLEELNLSDCTCLSSLPDNFGKLSNLKRLKIINCTTLPELSDGFGQLSNLKKLVMVNCTNLANLCDSFGQLSNLKKLVIVNCKNLSSLCSRFGQLESLEYLRIHGCRSLQRLSDDFGSLTCMTAIMATKCPVLEGKAVDQMIELKSLTVLNIRESQLLIRRWEEIKEGHTLIVRTESRRDNFLIYLMSRALVDAESRLVNVDGVVVDWSSNFTAVEGKIVFLMTCCDLCSPSNEAACKMVTKKIAELSIKGFQIIYVGLREQSEESIGQTLRHLSQGIEDGACLSLCAWIPPPLDKWKQLFGYSACMMLMSLHNVYGDDLGGIHTFIARAHISASENGNPQVQELKLKFPRWGHDKEAMQDLGGGFLSLYSGLWNTLSS